MNDLPAPFLNSTQKAALVLLGMGETTAAGVIKHMSPRDVRRLHDAMAGVARVTPNDSVKTLVEFLSWVKVNHSLRHSGATDFIRRAAAIAVGEDNLDEILTNEDDSYGGEVFTLLESVDGRVLSNLLQKEHPQTAALVLAYLSNDKASQVLVKMAPEMRTDILMRIAQMDSISPDTVRDVANTIELELAEFALMDQSAKVSGSKAVADIMMKLSGLDKAVSNATLTEIEDRDETLATDIRQAMFTFEDLESLDDRYIQALLREVDGESLVKALKSAPEPLRDKILGNMSARAAQIIIDDLESRGPMRVSEVTAAQQEIVRIALQMEQEGRLELGGGGGDSMV